MRLRNPLHQKPLLSGRIFMTTMTPQHNQLMNTVSVFPASQPDTTTESLHHLQSYSMRKRLATALPKPRRTTQITDMARLLPTQRNSILTKAFANVTQQRTFARISTKHLWKSTSCTHEWASHYLAHSTQIIQSMIGLNHSSPLTLSCSFNPHAQTLTVIERLSALPDLSG
jgi:hypothetical protein